MSLITDVVIVTMSREDQAIAHVNAHLLATDERKQQLTPLDMRAAGGSKVASACVYAAAFNYIHLAELKEALLTAPWRIPEWVTICIDSEDCDIERLTPGSDNTHHKPTATQ
jgi:hypothetical protein